MLRDYPAHHESQRSILPQHFSLPQFKIAAQPDCASPMQSSRGALQESYLDGPSSWDEVDTEELERIAVNILRSVVPSTENLEVGARLAMQVRLATWASRVYTGRRALSYGAHACFFTSRTTTLRLAWGV